MPILVMIYLIYILICMDLEAEPCSLKCGLVIEINGFSHLLKNEINIRVICLGKLVCQILYVL